MNGTHRLAQVQCFVGEEARRRRRIEETVVSVFEGWDYEEIIPPLFDYADVFTGEALAPKTYSFVARDGSVLALRPDESDLHAKLFGGLVSPGLDGLPIDVGGALGDDGDFELAWFL